MTHQQNIARKLIIESQEAGSQEMSIRRTNAGTAGTIAEKIRARQAGWYNERQEFVPLTVDEQAKELATWLADEEIEYAEEMLRIN